MSATVACGVGTVDDRLRLYAGEVEAALEAGETSAGGGEVVALDAARFLLPSRGVRRHEAPDERIGPFDYLATIGCSLSELAAERNGPLGRVLVPARRWAYERRVLTAIDDCAPTLGAERRAKLEGIAARKRGVLWIHRWNAIWSSEEIERYLSSGPAAMIGGRDPSDGPRQLRRAARAIAEGDLERLEAAHQQLRDDPAAGPRIVAAVHAVAWLEHVATRVSTASASACDREARRLTAVFEHRFVPLRRELVIQASFTQDFVEGLSALVAVSPESGWSPPEMRAYRRAVLGDAEVMGEGGLPLDRAYRDALVRHAQAWSKVLTVCGALPTA